ncbi:MAG: pyridoxine 5'-phosphate synthase [Gammaproteobacteria bacterium]|nr:pyridoxine 5'-phosphate synthase [Gammaproteobacteria bacterium]
MTNHSNDILLGVNIDHIATLRQARGTTYPEPVHAALLAEQSGADSITVHLREDRRHIQDRDVTLIKEVLNIPLNFEMAVTEEMLRFAENLLPAYCCLVPEKRAELTTEGGLDIVGQQKRIKLACERLSSLGIKVSLFIDPDSDQVAASKDCGAHFIEIHTGCYADAVGQQQTNELVRITEAARFAHSIGLIVNAGHGLHYQNVQAIAAIPEINELNIGHAIVARAVFSGLPEAVKTMKELMLASR